MPSKVFLIVDAVSQVNTMFSHAQAAATWAGTATLAFMGCLALAALAAYVVHQNL